MREYTKKPENTSRTLDSNPKASKQAPISEILQAYKNDTLGRQPVQRESIEDEDLLQTKTSGQAPISEIFQRYKESIQRYALEEDEELIQGKFDIVQREEMDEDEILQGKFEPVSASKQEAIQREEKPNNTGLPDNLKTGIENLSGYSMDDVKVHYNSNKPAQLQALAYTQGTNIHVASGQEKHLPHEAWHVVQQKQGRVKPTIQMQGVNVNDNEGLEKEAEIMGKECLQKKNKNSHVKSQIIGNTVLQRYIKIENENIKDIESIILKLKSIQLKDSNVKLITSLKNSSSDAYKLAMKWIESKPNAFGPLKLGYIYVAPMPFDTSHTPIDDPSPKAYWKEFSSIEDFVTALLAESDQEYQENLKHEIDLANQILTDKYTRKQINLLREKIGNYLMGEMNWAQKLYYGLTYLLPLPSLRGSYNWAGTYEHWWHSSMTLIRKSGDLTITSCISALHDMSELLFRDLVIPKLAFTWGFPEIKRPPAKIKGREAPPSEWHVTTEKDGLLVRDIGKKEKKKGEETIWEQDRGKHDIGTRDEQSSLTKLARKFKMPIEAGNSNTTARMMLMADKAGATTSEKQALAYALFAFWNSDKGYPKHMTPVHTFHEIMDVAASFGVAYEPFVYPTFGNLERKQSSKKESSESFISSKYTIKNVSGDGNNCLIRAVMEAAEIPHDETRVTQIRANINQQGAANQNQMLDLGGYSGAIVLSELVPNRGVFLHTNDYPEGISIVTGDNPIHLYYGNNHFQALTLTSISSTM